MESLEDLKAEKDEEDYCNYRRAQDSENLYNISYKLESSPISAKNGCNIF